MRDLSRKLTILNHGPQEDKTLRYGVFKLIFSAPSRLRGKGYYVFTQLFWKDQKGGINAAIQINNWRNKMNYGYFNDREYAITRFNGKPPEAAMGSYCQNPGLPLHPFKMKFCVSNT